MSTNQNNHYDFIIIGSGAGGATLAHRLAPTGKKILILERGDYLPREMDNWSSKAVFVDNKYRNTEAWYDKNDQPFYPSNHYYVGGNTKFYGAALFRLRKEDFGEIKHFGGISPAWPISYEELEPYYTEAEHLYHVHGEHGIDPTEPYASKSYLYPPVQHATRIQKLHDDLKSAGLHPAPLPLGILLNEKDGKIQFNSACVKCPAFDGFPCLTNGKADAQVICIAPTLTFSNVTMKTNACVTKLITDADGRKISAVHVTENGEQNFYSADIVVMACGALNSAALLLRSANEHHPHGLANSSDMVGRHYMRHNNSAFMAISKTPNPSIFQKTLTVNDYYFGADDSEFPLGNIQMLGKTDGEILKAEAPFWAKYLPQMSFEMITQHSVDFWVASEDLPDPENRLTLRPDGSIRLSLTPNNMEAHDRLVKKLKNLLHKINCHDHLIPNEFYFGKNMDISATAHQCGTVRFGKDPKTSVLDTNCKAHDVDNLYVVDGGFFVSIGAVNPTLTIIANALRVGDHLSRKIK